MAENEMVEWHHRHEFEQTWGDSEGQGSLVCCSPWGCKESDMAERLNNDRWYSGEESAGQRRRLKKHVFDAWVRKIPWNRKWQPTPVFLPGKFRGQKSLVGYSPQSHKEHTHIYKVDKQQGFTV